MLRRTVVAVVAIAAFAGPGAAQDSAAIVATARVDTTNHAYRYRLLGVFDAASGQPIEGAEVTDAFTGASARTSATGTVSLFFLPDGGSLVRIRKLGYAMRTMVVAISPADTAPVTVVLEPAVQLPEVVTTGRVTYLSPRLRGFEERRLRGATGHFIPESVLRKEEARTLANVLRTHIAGINIVQRGRLELLEPSAQCQTVSAGGTPPPDIYIDGVKLMHPPPPPHRNFATGGMQPFDLSEFDVSSLAGVEYYPGGASMPAEFSGASTGCGALLLWTREK
jgi:hypothetical protein